MRYLPRATAAIAAAAFVLACPPVPATEQPVAPGGLGAALASAADGAVLRLAPGRYRGPFTIARSVALVGDSDAVIEGDGSGTVITVDAPGVRIEGLTITGSGQTLATEDSGIFITAAGDGTVIAGNHLRDNLIGIYLKGPDRATVRDNLIEGLQDLRVNERGNGVQLWNTPGSVVEGNRIRYGRDGIFVTTSRDNRFAGNHFSDLRFAVHYMYTHDSAVTDNISTGNKVGYALMYSNRLVVHNNRSLGDSERGIFFNFTNESTIMGNIVAPWKDHSSSEKCVFVYNSNFNQLSGNDFRSCEIGIHFTAGSEDNAIWGNNFIGNRNQVKYVGTRELEWSSQQRGNYWSDHISFDLDGDGTANQAYRPNSVSDQILWRYPMAKLLMNSPLLQILQWAQSEFPALHPGGVTDSYPLMSPVVTGGEG
ncbi:nitrous oxide reductase family maturation protein NosD [Seongchinamella unica]|uniref:Nitrous oxide reductase family maturation protein NosD n=1 Tax=Seongchinamella unica TaxID=2547392 RepID=A0A4R5LTT7_9GAMM|nr:nitrous oxide reductase family maturation protein NosD [Seongchinamella unica]TDG14707.1 nitrous oxide reductase family maturation protein NosD [Seongchinamella unica]